jgi:hypothetical protein
MKSELLARGTDTGLRRQGDGLAPNLRGRRVVDMSLNKPGLNLENLNYRLGPVS